MLQEEEVSMMREQEEASMLQEEEEVSIIRGHGARTRGWQV
jgi:hypothetical protein